MCRCSEGKKRRKYSCSYEDDNGGHSKMKCLPSFPNSSPFWNSHASLFFFSHSDPTASFSSTSSLSLGCVRWLPLGATVILKFPSQSCSTSLHDQRSQRSQSLGNPY